jgi:putative hemolysin
MNEGDPGSNYIFPLLQASTNIGSTLIFFLIIAALLILTAIVAGSEVAFFSLSAKDLNYLKSKNKGANKTIINLLEKPKKLLATLIIANSFLSIGIIVTTGLLLEPIKGYLFNITPQYSGLLFAIFNIVLVTFLLVLMGEVLPKVYATQNNLRMSLFCAPIINGFYKFFSPFSNLLVRSSALLEKNINKKPSDISEEDVEHAIELTVGKEASAEEVNLIRGALNFRDIAVKQIMKPRLDVNGVELDSNFKQLQAIVLECGYSRLPVYIDTLDTIKGIIHTKDLLQYINNENVNWHTLIRPAFFVHETKLIEDILLEFKRRRIHMAVVVDEFGGTSGIVTLEDIMEEIIGEIRDEFDEDETEIKKINNSTFTCDGKVLINDFCRYIDEPMETFDEARGESDTMGGLWMELSGKFPTIGETVSYKNFHLMVQEIDKHRITKLKVSMDETPTAES